jgi:NodT family efflux transporter outer membrane factor (OMF) lipoprotein
MRLMTRRRVLAAALAGALALGGCVMGPDFSRPPPPQVDSYVRQAMPASLTAAGSTQTLSAATPLRDDWWTTFGNRDIDAAVNAALTGNATLAQAEASLRRADHELRAGAGVFYPQVSAQGGAARERYTPLHIGQDLPPSIFNLFTLSASVTYALDLWGGERRLVESLAAQRDAERYTVEAANLTIAANVVNTMIARAAYRDQIQATREMIELVQEQVRITKAQADAGTAAWAAVLVLQNEQATLEASLPALEQKRSQADDLLAELSGVFPAQWQAPDLTLRDITLPAGLPQTVPSSLVRRRPDILEAEAQLHAASAQIGVATAAMFPSVTLSAAGGFGDNALHDLTARAGQTWSIGADMTAPVFQGGSLWYGRKAAIDAFDASNAGYRQTVLSAFSQVADTLRALEHDAAGLDAQTRALAAAEEALRLLHADYVAGTADYLQILIADGQYHQARIAWLQADAQRLQDTVALYAALGGGWGEQGPLAPATAQAR